MIFSKPVTYAIRSLLFLSIQKSNEYLLGSEISKAIGIPSPYLIKILGILTSAGYLSSVRGPGGGFCLIQSPDAISLKNIVELFEGVHLTEQCLLGLGKCDPENICPLHDKWNSAREHLNMFLSETKISTLKQMVDERPELCHLKHSSEP